MKQVLLGAVVACLVVYTGADCFGPDRQRVKDQWQASFRSYQVGFGITFSNNVNNAYHGPASEKTQLQTNSVQYLSLLDMTINLLNNRRRRGVNNGLDMVIGLLTEPLNTGDGQQPLSRYDGKYDAIFRESLLRTLSTYLDSNWDRSAWANCYDSITAGIKTR